MACSIVNLHGSGDPNNPVPAFWYMTRDDDGYREYTAVFKVNADSDFGPAAVRFVAGLPQPGDIWQFKLDFDGFAVCTNYLDIRPLTTEDDGPTTEWRVELKFTTKPRDKCYLNYGTGTEDVGDHPLLEPDRISGSSVEFQEEATTDRNGDRIVNSAHEQIRGPQVEFDAGRDVVVIEQNVADVDLDTLSAYKHYVNDDWMWGFPPRSVKFSRYTWEKKWDAECDVFFVRRLEFDVFVKDDPDGPEPTSGFDRDLLDEGTKVLWGHWDDGGTGAWVTDRIGAFGLGIVPDPNNPAHFMRAQDRAGNPIRVVLNGAGVPATSDATAGRITVEKYPETNLITTLGIPSSIP